MTVCANRPDEEPGFFTPCAGWVDGATRTCLCGESVRADGETPVGEARVPDSARGDA